MDKLWGSQGDQVLEAYAPIYLLTTDIWLLPTGENPWQPLLQNSQTAPKSP